MAGSREPPQGPSLGYWPSWLTPRRLAEFAHNVWRLEQSVEALKAEAAETRSHVSEMQQQLATQAKQLELLTAFIQTSLNERIDLRAENAALKTLMSLKFERTQID